MTTTDDETEGPIRHDLPPDVVQALRDALAKIIRLGGEVVRQSGSHAIVRVPGGCQTVVPVHRGDLPKGTLGSIRKALAPCLGEDWLTR